MRWRSGFFPSLACLAVLLAAGNAPAQDSSQLVTAAAASGRPRECAPKSRSASNDWHVNLWDGAKQPQLRRYCDLLGRARVRLSTAPGLAREAASLADQVLPGHAAPWVLRARANVLLGDFAQAVQDFEHARSIDARSVEEPLSIYDLAGALRRSGNRTAALAAYRILLTRLSLLPSPEMRLRALLESASLAMSTGEQGLPEAVAILSEAAQQPLSRYSDDVHSMLLLAVDRAGQADRGAAAEEHFQRSGVAEAFARRDLSTFDYLDDPQDALALLAIAVERTAPSSATSFWDRFIKAAPHSPFLAHAKRHQDTLRKAPRTPPNRLPRRTP